MARFQCNVISYILDRAVDITVVIPTPTIPEATARAEGKGLCQHKPVAKYPVAYLLHGVGNNHATWMGYTNAELFAEERQIALVSFSAENKAYITSGDDDFFRFLSEELPDFVCGMFPISERPEDTYLCGLSMGGFGTLVHGFNFPERFAAIGTFSAAVALPADAGRRNTDPRFHPDLLADKLAKEGKPFPKIYMACGGKDVFLIGENRRFRDKLISLGADVTWHELPEYRHEWRFWNIEIERFLDWIPRTDYYASLGKRTI